jgi:hypothetical protein
MAVTGTLIGGIIVLAVQCRETARTDRRSDARELMENLAALDAAVSGEFQVYLSLAGKLAGKTVYGPAHLEELREINKSPDTFVEDARKYIEKAAAILERRNFDGKVGQTVRFLDSVKKADTLLASLFYETGTEGQQWKREPLKAAMVIHIYRIQIEDELKGLYREARRLYEGY